MGAFGVKRKYCKLDVEEKATKRSERQIAITKPKQPADIIGRN